MRLIRLLIQIRRVRLAERSAEADNSSFCFTSIASTERRFDCITSHPCLAHPAPA
jgi:hypothetical protein